jgi:predicted transcriptional regulator
MNKTTTEVPTTEEQWKNQQPSGVSDALWKHFSDFCDEKGVGSHPDDWKFVWEFYKQGYNFRCMENDAAPA